MMLVPVILLAGIFGLASVWWLVSGLRSGVMRSSFGTARVGEATRAERPAWFWIYAGLNVIIATICALLVSAMIFAGFR